ncbi:hypothetical protein F5Y14DRAFT_452450 [Nemania sp. NC0429]|nr:hypothetical protein F5Y14DRAFT_452450 [Nemania sp. NC0429]
MATLMEAAARLLHTGEYSDFTILCEGEEFHVHKTIVCPQSPVFSAALKSALKEGKTNALEVNFDITLLKCMLSYMYTATYPEKPAQPIQRAQSANDPKGDDQTDQQMLIEGSSMTPSIADTTVSDDLIYHARVNGIADYYDIKGLAQVSITRMETLFKTSWSAVAFCDLMWETVGEIGDKNLRRTLIQTASLHISELMKQEGFWEAKLAHDWDADLLEEVINTHGRDHHIMKAKIDAKEMLLPYDVQIPLWMQNSTAVTEFREALVDLLLCMWPPVSVQQENGKHHVSSAFAVG